MYASRENTRVMGVKCNSIANFSMNQSNPYLIMPVFEIEFSSSIFDFPVCQCLLLNLLLFVGLFSIEFRQLQLLFIQQISSSLV